jgi:hypothetical protein
MVSSDESRDSDHPAPRHSPLLSLKKVYSSRRDAALKPADLQPMEVREPPRAVREEPVYLRKERARLWNEQAWLRGEPTRWRERPMGLRTAATGPRPEETGLGLEASAMPLPPWIAARSAHG